MAKATILVVDDEATLRKLMQFHLRPHGYNVITAADGYEALEAVQREKPDLAIVDVMMPEMSGYDLTRALRDNPMTANIPVILLTALSNVQEKVEGFKAGADDFLIKPAELPELLVRVEALLRRAAAAAPAPPPKADARIFMVVSGCDITQATNVALNLAGLTQKAQPSIVVELVPAFTNTAFRLGLEAKQTLDDLLSTQPNNIGKPQFDDALVTHTASGVKFLVTVQDGTAPKTLTQEHTRALVSMAQRSNSIVYFVTHPMLGEALVPLYTSAEAALMVTRSYQEDLVAAMVLSQQIRNQGLPPTRLGLLVEHSPSAHNPTMPDMRALVARMRLSAAGAVPALGAAMAKANAEKKLPIQVAAEEDQANYQFIADLLCEPSIVWPLTPGKVASGKLDQVPDLPPSDPSMITHPPQQDEAAPASPAAVPAAPPFNPAPARPPFSAKPTGEPARPSSPPASPPASPPVSAPKPAAEPPAKPAPPPPAAPQPKEKPSSGGWFRPTRRGDK